MLRNVAGVLALRNRPCSTRSFHKHWATAAWRARVVRNARPRSTAWPPHIDEQPRGHNESTVAGSPGRTLEGERSQPRPEPMHSDSASVASPKLRSQLALSEPGRPRVRERFGPRSSAKWRLGALSCDLSRAHHEHAAGRHRSRNAAVVGLRARRLAIAARCSQRACSRPCATRIRPHPSSGTPDRSRTCDLLLRRQALYPSELRVHAMIREALDDPRGGTAGSRAAGRARSGRRV
jgi:hypothetical protein